MNNNIRPFSFRQKSWWTQILDPGGRLVTQWNHIFLISCLLALFLDPLYFYLPVIDGPACFRIDLGLGIVVTFFRTVADMFYLTHMIMKFRMAFVAPSSRVFGRGELVMDPQQIALRYLKSDFIIDFAATLPLPQVSRVSLTYQRGIFMIQFFVLFSGNWNQIGVVLFFSFRADLTMICLKPLNEWILKETSHEFILWFREL